MPKTKHIAFQILFSAMLLCSPAFGAETADDTRAQDAIERGLTLVQTAARNYPDHRVCFSCHHQTLPMFAMSTARARGFSIDETLMEEQATFTREFYAGRVSMMHEGKGVGGQALTAAYALWALDLAEQKRDTVSDALVAFLVKTQHTDGHWKISNHRPPLEESSITATFLAAYYMERFSDSAETAVSEAIERANQWVSNARPTSQEGLNFQLLAEAKNRVHPERISALRADVLLAQRSDGGWSQRDDMESDAYATGQTVLVLQETSDGAEETRVAIERGVQYLLKHRQPDGSWHVKSRSKPIQKMFDNGDPHGTDQFISTAATSWAVVALAWTRPAK